MSHTSSCLPSSRSKTAMEHSTQAQSLLVLLRTMTLRPSSSGAGYMEMAAAVARILLQGSASGAAVLNTVIAAPLILPHPSSQGADFGNTVLRGEVQYSSGTCVLKSGSTEHVSTCFRRLGGAASEASVVSSAATTARLLAQCSEPLATHYVYERLASSGLQYGPSFRLLRCVKRGRNSAAAKVEWEGH
jgi:hypothetical protein